MSLEKLIQAAAEQGIRENKLRERVQAKYDHFLLNGETHKIEGLQNITTLSPFWAGRTVQKAYRRAAQKGAIDEIIDIHEATGIQPRLSEKAIKNAYNRFLEPPYSELQESIDTFEQLTGVPPTFSDALVKKAYLELLRYSKSNPHYFLGEAKKLLTMTGFDPNNAEGEIKKIIVDLIRDCQSETASLVREFTHISFSETEAQKFYNNAGKSKHSGSIYSVLRGTNILPPEDMAFEQLVRHAQAGGYDTLEVTRKTLGLPEEKVYEAVIQSLEPAT
ncbi:MAG: hypothetical protein AABX51_03920 [Nanoarchaeota archaeon]